MASFLCMSCVIVNHLYLLSVLTITLRTLGTVFIFWHHHSGHNLYLGQWAKFMYTHSVTYCQAIHPPTQPPWTKKALENSTMNVANTFTTSALMFPHSLSITCPWRRILYWFRHPFLWRSNHPSRIHRFIDFAAFFHIINYFQWGSWALPRMVSGFWQPSSVCIGPCIESSYALQSGHDLSAVLAVWKRSDCSLYDIGAVEYTTGLCSLFPCWSTLCGMRL